MKGFSTNHPFFYDVLVVSLGVFIAGLGMVAFHKLVMPKITGMTASKPATATA